MTLSLSLSDLAHRYPVDICNRGIELYNEGRVGDLYFDEGRIEAEVEDGGDSYDVRISLNNRGVPVDTDCSCSLCFQAGYCSHITALLVKLINEKIQLVSLPDRGPGAEVLERNVFEDFPVSPLEKGIVSARVIPLEPEESSGAAAFPPDRKSLRPSAGEGTRWKGALNLRFRSGLWRLSPVLLYIKKDGGPGRIDRNFSFHRITEPLTGEEERFLRVLDLVPRGQEEGIPFEKLGDTVLKDRERLTLINDEGQPYAFLPLEKLIVSFDPQSERLFLPELRLPSPRSDIFPAGRILAAGGGELFLADEAGGTVYVYAMGDRAELFEFLRSRAEAPLSLDEIRRARERFAPCLDATLFWNFSPREIRQLTIVPGTVLTGYDGGEQGCAFRLSFDYGSRGVFPHDRHSYRTNGRPVRCREEEDESTLVLFSRDYEREGEIFRWLETWFLTLFGPGSYNSPLNRLRSSYEFTLAKPLTEFLKEQADFLLDRGIELRLEKQKGRVARSGGGSWQFRGTGFREWLALSLSYGDRKIGQAELEEFLQGGMLRAGTDLIIISSGEREKLRILLERGELNKGRLILSPLDYEALDRLEEDFGLTDDAVLRRAKERADRLKGFRGLESVPPPDRFRGELRPYQKGGYDWLHFLRRYDLGGCLADDMGLGKTVQTLCFLQSLKERGELGPVLLLAPVTTLMNWKGEAEKFTPDLAVLVHSGEGRSRSVEDLSRADLVLASYQTFLRDASWMGEVTWDSLILDEAQAVKNWQSKTRTAVRKLGAPRRLALTGTPVENGMAELWSLFDLLEPGLLGTRDMFRRRYQLPLEREGDKSRAEELRRRIAPLMLRRKKEDVLEDLPDKEETLVWLEMGEEQRRVYDEARRGFLALIEETLKEKDPSQAAMEVLTALLRLRQLAVIPALADPRHGRIPSCKLDFLDYFLDDLEAENHRVLIFSQFVQALALVRERLDRRGLPYAYLDGSSRHREEEIARFQEGAGPPVFLISLKAGGVGINLTAADYVLILDPWWNPAAENQAVDRAHRIGQKRSVMVYRPVVRDTVEERILELQARKRELVSDLITEEAGFLKSLTREETAALFR